MKIRILFFFLSILLKIILVRSQQTCSDCLEENGLEWCSYPSQDFNTSVYSRCLKSKVESSRWRNWCGEENIYHPNNDVEIVRDEPFTNPENNLYDEDKIIQIKPQQVQMKLSPGKPETLNIRFKFVRGYFLELYYLMDMSKSMEQDKETIVRLADDLATELKKLTPNLKLENPCVASEASSCRKPYGYQNILSLTNDTKKFIDSVNSAKLSTNWDDPEGGMDALIQAMVCEDIGWQTTTTRHLIVYVSGSAFKYAGDGKLAGLTTPNDMECHLDDEGNYLFSSLQDYPSISQVENASKDKRMHVIFAVKENVLPLYREVSTLIAQSEASELKEDSSNIIEIITSIYEDISSTLIMTDDSYKYPFLELSYSAKCGQGQDFVEGLSRCEDVDINEEIQFNLCTCGEHYSIKISPQGLEDELIVDISSNCECDCEMDSSVEENSEICSYNGKYACGVCVCNKGYTGKHCECEDTLDSTSGTENCKAPGDLTGKDCSGHGACKCGLCECQRGIEGNLQWKYQGEFCECSNFDCPKLSGFLCSNHGRCECSKCSCDVGWKGEDCSCDAGEDRCEQRIFARVTACADAMNASASPTKRRKNIWKILRRFKVK
ncbi:Integrin beta pat-3 [Armadillidium vulgare]|nr:Integrin beta pat-3 [Armadillidium vulgare]